MLRPSVLLAFACLVAFAHAQAEGLPPPVASALRAADIPQDAVAIVVQEAGGAAPRLGLNSRAAMNPASTIKLLTTFAALELLGPAHTWATEVRAVAPVAPVEEGVLAGNLYLRGSGDPSLTLEQFWLLLRGLRARGVRDIRGDLVLDRTALRPGEHDPAAFDGKPMRPYNVGPDALLLNFKAIRLTLVPDSGGKTIQVLPDPLPANLELVNRIRPGPNGHGGCGDWHEALRAEPSEHGGRHRLVLTGTYSAACGEKIWNVAPMPHDRYVLGVFVQIWRELGGRFEGGVRDGTAPADARLLATIDSPALADIVRNINKFSNNVMARQLYFALGRNGHDGGGRPEDGEAALRRWLAARGLDFPELAIENGTGLSRQERISAASLARLLAAAWQSPVMPELMSSLPVVAIDGTMKKRLKENGIAGRAHIKTGYLEGVRAIAGYVLDARGRRQIVVCFINHPNAKAAQPALDALLAWVYEGAT
ncbi:MAG: D-alanyl-D-alanine carboxypeptidase/D-alanyl-D-alanine-endopeptidase [Rhodocyclaceae bacterium]|nr:D-alanyl-D-alanine carboxypeptidase/D-alanyl-D-alanine-endopeptidase [Rhodocyclaceae bacterium]